MKHRHTPPQELVPGTVVTVQMKGLFSVAHHFALVTDKKSADGLPVMLSNSGELGGPGEQPWDAFVKGRPYRAFYPGKLAPETVLANAYSKFHTRYDFWRWNCEHFANACHGRPAQSHQVRGGLLLAAMGLALMAVWSGAAWAQGAPFTQAQVTEGHKTYSTYCAACHGDTLIGGGEAPPLTGASFGHDFSNQTVGGFFAYISNAMPQGLEGDLKPQEYADITAYVLAANGAMPGATPFTGKSAVKIGAIANFKSVQSLTGAPK